MYTDKSYIRGAARRASRRWPWIATFTIILLLSWSSEPLKAAPGDTTAVQLFFRNGIHFNPDNHNMFKNDSVDVLDNGRTILRNVTLPTFENPVHITATLEVIPDDKGNPCSADPWDKAGHVILTSPFEGTVELVKFITGYGGHTINVEDVTDLAPLLQGPATIQVFIDTFLSPAWKVNFKLVYIEDVSISNPDWATGVFFNQKLERPAVSDSTPTVTVDVPAGMEQFRLVYFTSGHSHIGAGGDEFQTKDNVVYVDGTEVLRLRPWRNNCSTLPEQNPCGNYPPSRSGWCPGDVVHPVSVDVSEQLSPGEHQIRFSVENIREQHGYWRISAYLAAWHSGAPSSADRIELEAPIGTSLTAHTPLPIRLSLRDAEGHLVHDGTATVRLSSDSAGVKFQAPDDSWVNPLEAEVTGGKAVFWLKSEVGGNPRVWATDASGVMTGSDSLELNVLVNYAQSGTARGDCECNRVTENAARAIDGRTSTKWCCNNDLPDWLEVSLPDTAEINYFVIHHAGATTAPIGDPGHGDTPAMNTTDFDIQVKNDQGSWESVVSVRGNPGNVEGNVTNHVLADPIRAQDFRLYITDPGADNAARIYEFQMYDNPDLSVGVQETPYYTIIRDFRLSHNYPNPFNAGTTINFEALSPGRVVAKVLNSRGQLVAELTRGYYGQGNHSVFWNGKDLRDRDVASGVYVLTIRHEDAEGVVTHRTTKMVYLR